METTRAKVHSLRCLTLVQKPGPEMKLCCRLAAASIHCYSVTVPMGVPVPGRYAKVCNEVHHSVCVPTPWALRASDGAVNWWRR